MDDALTVGIVQGLGHLVDDADDLRERHQIVGTAIGVQSLGVLDEFHHQIADVAVHVGVKHPQDVWMIEQAGGVGFR